ARHVEIAPGAPPEVRWIDLQLHQVADSREPVAEEEARALHRADQVANHRKAPVLDAGKVESGAANLIDAAVHLGRFQVGVDFLLDAQQLAAGFQVGETGLQAAVAHESSYGQWERMSTMAAARNAGSASMPSSMARAVVASCTACRASALSSNAF